MNHAPVAQLDSASVFETEGCWFESNRVYFSKALAIYAQLRSGAELLLVPIHSLGDSFCCTSSAAPDLSMVPNRKSVLATIVAEIQNRDAECSADGACDSTAGADSAVNGATGSECDPDRIVLGDFGSCTMRHGSGGAQ